MLKILILLPFLFSCTSLLKRSYPKLPDLKGLTTYSIRLSCDELKGTDFLAEHVLQCDSGVESGKFFCKNNRVIACEDNKSYFIVGFDGLNDSSFSYIESYIKQLYDSFEECR